MRFPGHETVPIGNRVRVNAALFSPVKKVKAFNGCLAVSLHICLKDIVITTDCGKNEKDS